MNALELLDEIFKNYSDVGNSASKQIEAHAKSIKLIDDALKKEYQKGLNSGKDESVQNLIKKN